MKKLKDWMWSGSWSSTIFLMVYCLTAFQVGSAVIVLHSWFWLAVGILLFASIFLVVVGLIRAIDLRRG